MPSSSYFLINVTYSSMKASYSSIAALKSGSTPSEAAGFSVGLLLSLSSLPDCSVLSEVRGFSVRTVSVCALFDDPEGSESFWDFDTHKTITQTTTAAAMTSTARNLKNPLKNPLIIILPSRIHRRHRQNLLRHCRRLCAVFSFLPFRQASVLSQTFRLQFR